MTDQFSIPITTHVPGPLYQALQIEARKSHRRVGDLLVEHAAENINVEIVIEKPRRTWARMTDQHVIEAAQLWHEGKSQVEIARMLSLSRSTIRNHWQRVIAKAQTLSEEQAA